MKQTYKKLIFVGLFSFLSIVAPLNLSLAKDTKPPSTQTSNYIPLTPIGDFVKEGKAVVLHDYITNMIKLGIAVAAGLAVVMMILGGVEYMSTDAIFGKEEGKSKVNDAIIGLVMALCSYLILQTINTAFLDNNLKIENVTATVNTFELPNLPPPPQPIYSGPKAGVAGLQKPGQTAAQAILENAQYSADTTHPLNTNVPGTEGGKLGCAYAVNEIVESALGKPITNGLGTPEMYETLKTSPYFTFIEGGVSQAQPGDIIISPSVGDNHGHVGVIETAGGGSIISNSSSDAKVERNYNAGSWTNRYQSTKGLGVYIFRAK